MSANVLDMLNDEIKQKLSGDYGIECNPYIVMPKLDIGLINASVPLTRRERRALKRKKLPKKCSSSYIVVSEKVYNLMKQKGLIDNEEKYDK